MPEDEFIKFRLKQGVYGQRQPDVQMIRVKLPFGGITPEQLEKFADVVETLRAAATRATSPRARTSRCTTCRCPTPSSAIRELGRGGAVEPRGLRQHVRNVTGDPWAGVATDELFDMTPYVGAYVRYFVRHPTTQAMPRKVKTSFDGSAARPRDHRHPRHRLPRARARVRRPRATRRGPRRADARRRRHLDHAARRAGAVRVRGARQRRVPEGHRGGVAHLRPPGVAAREPRAGAHQGVRRQVRHRRAAPPGRGGATGRLGRRTRLLDRAPPVPRRRAESAPAAPRVVRHAQRRPVGVRALPRAPTCAPRSRRAS